MTQCVTMSYVEQAKSDIDDDLEGEDLVYEKFDEKINIRKSVKNYKSNKDIRISLIRKKLFEQAF